MIMLVPLKQLEYGFLHFTTKVCLITSIEDKCIQFLYIYTTNITFVLNTSTDLYHNLRIIQLHQFISRGRQTRKGKL